MSGFITIAPYLLTVGEQNLVVVLMGVGKIVLRGMLHDLALGRLLCAMHLLTNYPLEGSVKFSIAFLF
jgi:hypothetical protein